jgi:hypothetical protein
MPPARPAHGFTYNAVNQDSVNAPPSAGAGRWATEYRHNLDRQLTQVLRPDAQIRIGRGLRLNGTGQALP